MQEGDDPNGRNDRLDPDEGKPAQPPEPLSSQSGLGPCLQITILASGFWKCCNHRPDRGPHSINPTGRVRNFLHYGRHPQRRLRYFWLEGELFYIYTDARTR